MHHHADQLKDIVQTAREGASFYEAARDKASKPQLREVFTRMAEAKHTLITELSAVLMAKGEALPEGGSTTVALRKVYADVRAMVSSNDDAIYVGELEEVEDRLVSEMKTALIEATDPAMKTTLQHAMVSVSQCHNEMRDLKHSMAD
ncbi:MAG: PA2169 family four-helix-bundle protein [Pseudomonadota bacterium]